MRVWISSSGGIHPERIGAWISASGGTSWNRSLDFFICISFSKIWIALKTAQDWIEVGFGRGNCGSIKNPDVLAHASLSSRFSVWRSQHVLADMLSAKSYSHYRNECLPKCSRRSIVLVYKWMWDETSLRLQLNAAQMEALFSPSFMAVVREVGTARPSLKPKLKFKH